MTEHTFKAKVAVEKSENIHRLQQRKENARIDRLKRIHCDKCRKGMNGSGCPHNTRDALDEDTIDTGQIYLLYCVLGCTWMSW